MIVPGFKRDIPCTVLSIQFVILILLSAIIGYCQQLPQDTVEFKTKTMTCIFSKKGGNIIAIESSYPSINSKKCSALFHTNDRSPLLTFKSGSSSENLFSDTATYLTFQTLTDSTLTIEFLSPVNSKSIQWRKIYVLWQNQHKIIFTNKIHAPVQSLSTFLPGTTELVLSCNDLILFSGSGQENNYSTKLGKIIIDSQSVHKLTHMYKKTTPLKPGSWIGFAQDQWAFIARTSTKKTPTVITRNNQIVLQSGTDSLQWSTTLYPGPIDAAFLSKVDNSLTGLQFRSLWFWVAWIAFFLQFLLKYLTLLVHEPAIAILALSIAVKGLMYPLTRVAQRWQSEVNQSQMILQEELRHINSLYKGYERNQKTLELYKKNNIHPLYSLKSLMSVGIQIPIFFAAYHALKENIALAGYGFLWFDDLTLPDHAFSLPFDVPFFGNQVNILPLVMTLISVASAYLFKDISLSKEVVNRQKRNLFGMAILFFVLLYHFPSSMVLYWTMNNVNAFMLTAYQWKKYKRT